MLPSNFRWPRNPPRFVRAPIRFSNMRWLLEISGTSIFSVLTRWQRLARTWQLSSVLVPPTASWGMMVEFRSAYNFLTTTLTVAAASLPGCDADVFRELLSHVSAPYRQEWQP